MAAPPAPAARWELTRGIVPHGPLLRSASSLHFPGRRISLDRERGELVLLSPGDRLRELPDHTLEIEVHAVDEGGGRALGRYTMFHSAWRG